MSKIIFYTKQPKQSFRTALRSKVEYQEIPTGKSIRKFYCIKYAAIIYNSVIIRENAGQRKRVFSHILFSCL